MGKHHPHCIYYRSHFNVHERTQKWRRDGLGTFRTEPFTSQTIFRYKAPIIWFLCSSYKCKLILILILFATFQLLKFPVDKVFVTAESAATTTKLVEPFAKRKEEETGRFMEPENFLLR